MRLYLSSLRFGDRFDLLCAMLGQGARIGVIANALDLIPAASREAYARNVHDPVAELNAQGMTAAPLDLRDYFAAPQRLDTALAALDAVWVTGGNSFLLRRAMRQSGFDIAGVQRIKDGKLLYGGYSAGAIVAGPSLRGIEAMDDPSDVAEGYDPAPIWDGLDLIGLHLVPHYDCGSADSPAAANVTAYLLDHALPYRTMRDGDVLIRDANGIRAYER